MSFMEAIFVRVRVRARMEEWVSADESKHSMPLDCLWTYYVHVILDGILRQFTFLLDTTRHNILR